MHTLFDKCKRLARLAKFQSPVPQSMPLDVRDNVPSREISDQLIHCYFRTFESTYRILHIPSFQTEYQAFWLNPSAASDLFVIKLLVVMAIGTCFYQEPSNPTPLNLRVAAVQWIYTAQTWLSSPFEKRRINLAILQIHCLVLLARETNAVDGDYIWISAGSLLRTAMHIGLHRDPSHVPKVSLFYAEQRRRVWATVLEMLIQSSMDSGSPPLISLGDFDCGPPSNIDDLQIDESTKTLVPKPEDIFTETSIQITLTRSLPVRLAIAKLLNDFRSEASYDETLRLAADLTAACRHNAHSIESWLSHSLHPNTGAQPTSFQIKLLELLTHRFILALHMPFVIKARTNPIYYFSRKISLETSLFLLSPPRPPPQSSTPNSFQPPPPDDYTSIKICGDGLFRGVPLRAVIALALELISQLSTPSAAFLSTSESIERREARRAIEEYVELTTLRMAAGECSVKGGHVFTSCILAQIDALQAGTSVDAAVGAAVARSVDHCYGVLKQRAAVDAGGEDPGTGWSGSGSEYQTGDRSEENTVLDGFGWDGMVQDPRLNFEIEDSWFLSDWVPISGNSWL